MVTPTSGDGQITERDIRPEHSVFCDVGDPTIRIVMLLI